ncbi:uncharacterized protein LOC116413761 [Galleria mellonella]|uniref:Uncharacterized protein LOC116413761 n=1 Tax=Galleria mellonella TaxID=7137 RepID=A0A6J3CF03_GALME|nr:uncharacterized protein LOC116413761 [Galleria mellonella]
MNSRYVLLMCLFSLYILATAESARKNKKVYRKQAHEKKGRFYKKVPRLRTAKSLAFSPTHTEAEILPNAHNLKGRHAESSPMVDLSMAKTAPLQSETNLAVEDQTPYTQSVLPIEKYDLPVMQSLPVLSGLPVVTTLPEVNVIWPIKNPVEGQMPFQLLANNISPNVDLNLSEIKYEIIDVIPQKNNPILHKWFRFEEMKRKLFHRP